VDPDDDKVAGNPPHPGNAAKRPVVKLRFCRHIRLLIASASGYPALPRSGWDLDATQPGKPIKTEADYDAALKEVEHLFDTKPNTPETDRLEVFITLVEVYEERHTLPSPGPI
jgi:hypothetical protein